MSEFVITEPLVRKLLATVDRGLSHGLGVPEPGKMCVEAAIAYAMGEPHSDRPSCVDPCVRSAKIRLNDALWSGPIARARGLRAVAIAQLGSKGTIDAVKFVTLFAEYVIREVVPIALRAAATLTPSHAAALESSAARCQQNGDMAAAYAAEAAKAAAKAAYAAYAAEAAAEAAKAAAAVVVVVDAAAAAAYAAAEAAYAAEATKAAYEKDRVLSLCAGLMVRALQDCHAPGCEWLWLLDEIPVS